MAQQPESPAPEQKAAAGGGALLARLANEMVRALKEFFGKGPTKAKAYMLDDMLIVAMRDGMTRAETTMLEFGHPDQVRRFRQLFQDEMTEHLTAVVEQMTGRKVVNYQSQVMFDPDLIVEIFVFDSDASSDALEAGGDGQLDDVEAGMATDADARERPSASGQ